MFDSMFLVTPPDCECVECVEGTKLHPIDERRECYTFVSSFDVLLVCLFVVCLLICLFFRFVAVALLCSVAIATAAAATSYDPCKTYPRVEVLAKGHKTHSHPSKDVMLT